MTDVVSYVMLLSALGGGDLPFWATANQNGIYAGQGQTVFYACSEGKAELPSTLRYEWALSFEATSDVSEDFKFIPDQISTAVGFRNFELQTGLWHRTPDFFAPDRTMGSLSLTGGNIVNSGNARPMPGYSFTIDKLNIPWTKGLLQLSAAFGDYLTIDERYVLGAAVHNESLSLSFNPWRFRFSAGIDHYAMWGGKSPEFGRMPTSFKDYLRVCFGLHAGPSGTASDQVNVIGNHLGREFFRMEYTGEKWSLTLQHDIPYDDKSGMRFENFPDGVNTICVSLADKDALVSCLVYEYANTMDQSGTAHSRLTTDEEKAAGLGTEVILNGNDNYFNNGEYKSGWTHFGRVIGIPLFATLSEVPGGEDDRMFIYNNKVVAHHVGIGGKFFRKVPYRLMLTYSRNYGRNNVIYYDTVLSLPGLEQYSLGFNAAVPIFHGYLSIVPSFYLDRGDFLPKSVSGTIGIRFNIH